MTTPPRGSRHFRQLATDLGFDAIDAGPLKQARLLGAWGMLWIYLAFNSSVGRDYGFGLLRRGGK